MKYLIILMLSACTETKQANSPPPNCNPVGNETTYRFSAGVEKAQMYNCIFDNKKCSRIVSLESGEVIDSCTIPQYGSKNI